MEPTETPQAAATVRILRAAHPRVVTSSLLTFKMASFEVTTVLIEIHPLKMNCVHYKVPAENCQGKNGR